jgi:hypothetical protein
MPFLRGERQKMPSSPEPTMTPNRQFRFSMFLLLGTPIALFAIFLGYYRAKSAIVLQPAPNADGVNSGFSAVRAGSFVLLQLQSFEHGVGDVGVAWRCRRCEQTELLEVGHIAANTIVRGTATRIPDSTGLPRRRRGRRAETSPLVQPLQASRADPPCRRGRRAETSPLGRAFITTSLSQVTIREEFSGDGRDRTGIPSLQIGVPGTPDLSPVACRLPHKASIPQPSHVRVIKTSGWAGAPLRVGIFARLLPAPH